MFKMEFLPYFTIVCFLYTVQGKTVPVKDKLCHSSSECAKDSCCRDETGRLVDPSGLFDHVGPITDVLNGTCVPLHAQFDENCGEFCPCDLSQGLVCYRTVTDNEFSPSVCRPKDVVSKWTNEFLDCWNDPKCVLPL
ncbi:uncharacterized protein LOC128162687 [Crassostrea angulata]|uniref:uncharacterized protein n=1 Tax=Magallana gigas TaxID=29159 RepID=UPI0022B12D5B|nr:uncharacterized protein LOC128162687 [Crassostrea angulata]